MNFRPSNGDFETIGKDLKEPTLNVKKLVPDESYGFIVQAENKFGKSDHSDQLVVPSRAGKLIQSGQIRSGCGGIRRPTSDGTFSASV